MEVPKDMFLEFLKEISPKFQQDKYYLFKNNCNHFIDGCSQFLVGEEIPRYITSLPEEVFQTSMGGMLQPSITQIQQRMAQKSHPTFKPPQNNNSFVNTQNKPSEPAFRTANNLQELFGLVEKYPAAIVGCFANTCGPSAAISLAFERMAKDFTQQHHNLVFIKVMLNAAPNIVIKLNIRAVPTFIGFYKGLKLESITGASESKIRELLKTLIGKLDNANGGDSNIGFTIIKGKAFNFEFFNPYGPSPFGILSDNYQLPIGKIQDLVEKDKLLNKSSMKDAFNVLSQAPQQPVKQFNKDKKIHLITWLCETLLYIGNGDKVIPFIDLLRMLCADLSYTDILVANQGDNLI